MIYNVPFRFRQALEPSTLPTISATLNAIEKAQADCRNAGVDPETDPAVVLLARHLASVSTNKKPDQILRDACSQRLTEIKRFPALLVLAARGVEYDPLAKERFHIDAVAALHDLAAALELLAGKYEVLSTPGSVDESGYVLLAAEAVAVTVRVGLRHEGREVAYRAVEQKIGETHRFASMAELLKPARLAARLRRDIPSLEQRPPTPITGNLSVFA